MYPEILQQVYCKWWLWWEVKSKGYGVEGLAELLFWGKINIDLSRYFKTDFQCVHCGFAVQWM